MYKGEGVGALLGTKLISCEWGIWSANIYIDNQASIAATTLMKPCPGHYIFDAFHHSITALQKKHTGIRIKWVPGRRGVEGNKGADEQVKKAITEGSSELDKLLKILRKKLPYSKSVMLQAFGKS